MNVIGERPRVAAEMFPVRDLIREELAFRSIDESKAPVTLRLFLDGDTDMTPKVSQVLAAMFGTSLDFWVNLDRSHREWKAAQS